MFFKHHSNHIHKFLGGKQQTKTNKKHGTWHQFKFQFQCKHSTCPHFVNGNHWHWDTPTTSLQQQCHLDKMSGGPSTQVVLYSTHHGNHIAHNIPLSSLPVPLKRTPWPILWDYTRATWDQKQNRQTFTQLLSNRLFFPTSFVPGQGYGHKNMHKPVKLKTGRHHHHHNAVQLCTSSANILPR